MANHIFICRHTKVHNPEKVVYRRLSGFRLSVEGEREAQLMGEFFKNLKIKEIFTSPMERCQQVAQIIKEAISNPEIKIYTKDYLNEWDEGERTRVVAARMRFILNGKKSSRVYISHKDPMRVFFNKLTGAPLKEIERWDCPHGDIFKISFDKRILFPKLLFVPDIQKGKK